MKTFIRIILLSSLNLNFFIPGANKTSAQSSQFHPVRKPIGNGYVRTTNQDSTRNKLKFINTAFENASQLDWEVDSNGVIHANLIYDHQRSSLNRANGHWHFQVEAEPGAEFTMLLGPFANFWNEEKSSPVSDSTNCIISKD